MARLKWISVLTAVLASLSPGIEAIAAGIDSSPNRPRLGDDPIYVGSTSAAPSIGICPTFAAETDFVEFDLWLQLQDRSVRLRFPAQYVESPRSYRSGGSRTASYIRVDIFTFEPISRSEDSRRVQAGNYEKMGILFGDGIPLEDQARISAALSAGHPLDREEIYPEVPGLFGLAQLDFEGHLKEVFVARDENEEISDLVRCSTEQMVRFPVCSQSFKVFGINVQASYRRSFLKEWEGIRDRISEFLRCAATISQ